MLKAIPAQARATNKDDHSISTVSLPMARGACNTPTHDKYMIPSHNIASRTFMLVNKQNADKKKAAITT
jgi:hypothetical protein